MFPKETGTLCTSTYFYFSMARVADLSSAELIGLRDAFVVLFQQLLKQRGGKK